MLTKYNSESYNKHESENMEIKNYIKHNLQLYIPLIAKNNLQ